MANLTFVYWRDIPAQVIASKSRRETVRQPLDVRFEQAIDKAAMKSKASSTDDYLADWRKVSMGECSDDLSSVVAQNIATLEREYDDEHLATLIAQGGYAQKSPEDA